MGLPWSGCTECDHQQEGDDQDGQQDDHVDQQDDQGDLRDDHVHQQPSDGKTGIPGGERKDAANKVARTAVSRIDQTFALSVCHQ